MDVNGDHLLFSMYKLLPEGCNLCVPAQNLARQMCGELVLRGFEIHEVQDKVRGHIANRCGDEQLLKESEREVDVLGKLGLRKTTTVERF